MSDDAWLAGLRGKLVNTPDASSAADRAEGDTIRQAVLAVNRQQADVDVHGLERLMFRLQKEGLRDGPAHGKGRWQWPAALAAAVVLSAAVLVVMQVNRPPDESSDPQMLRGGATLQRVKVPDVESTLARCKAVLLAAGGQASVASLGAGTVELSATVPPDRVASVTAPLAACGIGPPSTDGLLRVELHPNR